jgi:hypothetical protein
MRKTIAKLHIIFKIATFFKEKLVTLQVKEKKLKDYDIRQDRRTSQGSGRPLGQECRGD